MSFFHLKPDTKELVKAFSLAGMIIVAFYLMLGHLDIIGNAIASIFHALAPFIYGIFFAFILVPLRNIVEQKWLKNVKWSKKTKRRLAVAFAMIVMILILVGFFAILMPQLVSSIEVFITNLSGYFDTASDAIAKLTKSNPELADRITDLLDTGRNSVTKWLTGASGGLSAIMDYVSGLIQGIINFLIGMIIAMYLMADSEKFKLQVKKICYAVFPVRFADKAVYVMKLTADMFYKFIFGKAVDSLIIGILCYICCKFMKMPYTVLIAVVVGITNMIPVFGPFIGAIPCLIILVMIDWVKALEFLIFIIILQQCDGNIIGPYILGDAVGLPTVWVMFAIIVGGSLFGVVGMFIGVPAFAVIYTLFKDWSQKRLKQKKITLKLPSDDEEKEA